MAYREQLIKCPDGRVLEVATMGDPAGHTIVFHHGTPVSTKTMLAFEPLVERGTFYFVTTSRPGYGASDRLEGRNVAAVVDDTRTVLDALGRDSYVALGWSGGGPHALACAALDTPRCRKVVSLASVVPMDVDFDWTEGIGPENLEEYELAKEGGPVYEEYIATAGAFIAAMDKDNVIEMMSGLLCDVDREVLDDDHARELFATGMSYGFANGWYGYFDDNSAFYLPWGFDPTTIDVPVALFCGGADLMAPPSHGAWLSGHLPSATTHDHPLEGHLSIYARHLDEVQTELASAFES